MNTKPTIAVIAIIVCGCSKPNENIGNAMESTPPIVALAANAEGVPQIDYSGDGKFTWKQDMGTFSLEVSGMEGAPYLSLNGSMSLGDSNDVSIAIASESDHAFELKLFGLLATNNLEAVEDDTIETIVVPEGKHQQDLNRFIIYTYEF